MLAAGAWLVLRQELTPGAMIASSIVMGRALAPVDQLVGGWPSVQAAQDGWGRLAGLLSRQPADPVRTPFPAPRPAGGAQPLGRPAGRGAGHPARRQLRRGAWHGPGGHRPVGRGQVDAGAGADRRVARGRRQHPSGRRDAGPVPPRRAGRPDRLSAPAGDAVRRHDRRKHRPPFRPPRPRPGGARRTGGRRAPDDPGPAAGIRHAHQPDGGPSVGRPDSAHRPGPRALSRPRAAGSGRAELEPGQPGVRGAECRDPAAEVAGRRGHHHGPPSRRDQRMRKPAGAGGRRPPRLRPARDKVLEQMVQNSAQIRQAQTSGQGGGVA